MALLNLKPILRDIFFNSTQNACKTADRFAEALEAGGETVDNEAVRLAFFSLFYLVSHINTQISRC